MTIYDRVRVTDSPRNLYKITSNFKTLKRATKGESSMCRHKKTK